MNRIKNKIKSNEGASITFALLIFLVCAVVSTIVIVAATASAGRMSQAAKMDQRYFSVTSAAELLKNKLDGQSVIVKRVKKYETVKTSSSPTMSNPTSDGPKLISDKTEFTLEGSSVIINPIISGESPSGTSTDSSYDYTKFLLTQIAHDLASTSDESSPTKAFPCTRTFVLDVGSKSALSCKIDETINEDGTISMDVYNYDPELSEPAPAFTLQVSFLADAEATEGSKATTGTVTQTGSTYEVKDLREETTTTKVAIHFLDIS